MELINLLNDCMQIFNVLGCVLIGAVLAYWLWIGIQAAKEIRFEKELEEERGCRK